MRMRRIRPVDAGTLLMRALRRHAAAAGCTIHIESLAMRPWSSATFLGTRHRIALSAVSSDALAAWLGELAEAPIEMRGHLVADLAVEDDRIDAGVRRVMLAVLTLEEA